MVQYRRNRVEGASYYFTVNLNDRSKDYLTRYIHDLRHSFRVCRASMPFTIDVTVILPEHLHCIWTLPDDGSNYSARWRKVKTTFTQRLIQQNINISKDRHGQYNLWQRRYWERTIRNDKEFSAYVDYIHYNPVKHGYVSKVQDWKYSSFHRFVREGKLSRDWGGENLTNTLGLVGE
ncbi:transposase [Kangiella japonica]|uniref:Transposase n=1 Tax=Kangiella japonica TaxID=647384 RepID=A0ABP3CFF8_9GAMM